MSGRPSLNRPAEDEAKVEPEVEKILDQLPSSWQTIPTGSTLLDLALNGGWAVGRVINLVGDSSAGKTLLAIEAMANFAMKFSIKNGRYNETENAFLLDYAQSIGLPLGLRFVGDDEAKEVDRHGSATVEHFEEDLAEFIRLKIGKGKPSFYVLDSFDALDAAKELKRDFGDRQPGVRAALLSEFFRKHIGGLAGAECSLMIISQLRDMIGVMFGETQTRSGGRALRFFSSQEVWLATGKKITGKVSGVERTTGTHSIFTVKKNKLGKPFARANMVINYNYGIDDELSNLEWLEVNKLGAVGRLTLSMKEYPEAVALARQQREMATLREMNTELKAAVTLRWEEIDAASAPPIRKYGELMI
jgi:recombination protein RecA